MITNLQNDVKIKKKVGRPPTRQQTQIKIDGICMSPKNNLSNIVEICIQDITLFKYIFNYFKNVKITTIEFEFLPDKLLLKSNDHCNRSELIIVIDGKKLTRYFVLKPITKYFSRETIEKIFISVDKTYNNIELEINEDSQDMLNVKYVDNEINRSCNYSISIPNIQQDVFVYSNISRELNSSMISFTLNTKKFKSFITNAINFSSKFEIVKQPSEEGIQFTYSGKSVINCSEVYNDSNKIGLESNIGKGLYRREMPLQIIKPYVSSFTNDNVIVFCQKDTFILSSNLGENDLATVNVIIR